MTAHQLAQEPGEFDDDRASGFRLRPDERRHRGQRVEEEVRVDLAFQGLDLGGEEQFFLFGEAMFDARVVPDLDGDGDGEDGGNVDGERQPPRG